jgi:hypothetical protein
MLLGVEVVGLVPIQPPVIGARLAPRLMTANMAVAMRERLQPIAQPTTMPPVAGTKLKRRPRLK